MKIPIIGAICASALIMSVNTNAALLARLGGLAYYDTNANITWLADANYAQTSGYDADGRMDWFTANQWAATLNISGITGWQLGNPLIPDTSCSDYSVTGNSTGFTCTGSDMGNLYYNVLGGQGQLGYSLLDTHNANYDLFSNIQNSYYWMEAETANPAYGYLFDMNHGGQGYTAKGNIWYAWAMHTGDVGTSVVPLPTAVWLFGSGLLGLIGIARHRLTA